MPLHSCRTISRPRPWSLIPLLTISRAVDVTPAATFMLGGGRGDPGAFGDWGLMVGGVAVLLGHCFPFMHEFRGGKGVAVGGITSLMVHPIVGCAVFGSFLIAALLSRKVSLGSLCGALAITVASLLVHVSLPRLLLSIIAMCVVIFQHRENIKRLIAGTEPDFHAKTR